MIELFLRRRAASHFLVVLIAVSHMACNAQQALSSKNIEEVLNETYNKFKDLKEGKNADYIKELANVDPNIYGIAIVTVDGRVFVKGDISSMVSIQSVSKVFTMA